MLSGIRHFLKREKKWIWTFLLFLFVFFALRLPYTEIVDKAARKALDPLPANIQFKKTALHILPPALSFRQVSVSHRSLAAPFETDQIRVSPAWLKWMTFSKGLKVHFLKEGTRFSLVLSLKKITKKKIKKSQIQIKGESFRLHPTFLQSLLPSMQMKGNIQIEFEIEGFADRPLNGKGFAQIRGRDIKLNQILLNTGLGPLHLPDIQWKEARVILRLSKERVTLEKFLLGRDTDPFSLQMKGSLELGWSRGRLRPGKYDLRLSAQTDRNFKLSLMDLLLINTKTPTDGGWRYLARITGSGTKPPDIEQISEF